MLTTFKTIKVYGAKSGRCSVCGKAVRRDRVFEGTVNPFNRNPDGSVRTSEDVYNRLRAEEKAWMSKPVMHRKCESNG